MDSLMIGQFADLRAYLVCEIMSRCKQLHDQPETWQDVADFLENFPETLQLLKTSGQEEAKVTNITPPICFGQRIDRLISIICVLQSRIENSVLATTEVPHILSEMCAHIGRLTIDRLEQSDYLDKMESYAAHISDSYWAPREDGREPAITYDQSQAEAFSIWNRLDGPFFDCDCRQCFAPNVDQADFFTLGKYASFQKHIVTELLSHTQRLEDNETHNAPIIGSLNNFASQLDVLMQIGQEEAEFTRNPIPFCLLLRCAILKSAVSIPLRCLEQDDIGILDCTKILKHISLHVGRLSINYDHSSDTYVVEAERIIKNINLYYRSNYDNLARDEAGREFMWDGLNIPFSGCACLQCLTRVEMSP